MHVNVNKISIGSVKLQEQITGVYDQNIWYCRKIWSAATSRRTPNFRWPRLTLIAKVWV